MGLFDKVKGQAKDLKGKVGERVEDEKAKRRADDLLDDLGRVLYAEKTGRPITGADAEVSRVVAELRKLEDDGVTILPA
jgi:hypothetical protein